MAIKVTALKYAESTLPQSSVLQGGDKQKALPISFIVHLIETEGKRILADAGCETMPGFDMRHFCSPVQLLKSLWLRPEDITDVVLTHAHHDHIECVKYFGRAVIHIQRDELEEGRPYIPQEFQVHAFDEDYEVCPGVRVLKIGGHTKGSCIVELEAAGEKYVIAGDECYRSECLEKKIPTGSSCCPEKSREFVEKYGSGRYHVLLCHDEKLLPGRNGTKVLLCVQ